MWSPAAEGTEKCGLLIAGSGCLVLLGTCIFEHSVPFLLRHSLKVPYEVAFLQVPYWLSSPYPAVHA